MRHPPRQPVVAAGAVAFENDRILLVKRINPPAAGRWAVPGGRVRTGERLQETVRREVREETGFVVETGEALHVFDIITPDETDENAFHYVIIDFAAKIVGGELRAGDDASEARFLSASELNALPVDKYTLDLLAKLEFL